jgi:hypothetical protein
MSLLKSIILGACLTAPMAAGATTTSFSNVAAGSGDGPRINTTGGPVGGSAGSFTGTGFATVDMGAELIFADRWTLAVSPGETAQIQFSDISPGSNNITAFVAPQANSSFGFIPLPSPILTVTATLLSGNNTYTYSGINPGTYYFNVGGSSTNPDVYRVNTTVSAVPLPAAVWLMGSGLVGLLSFRNRKTTALAA